jgi:hypothetical protein
MASILGPAYPPDWQGRPAGMSKEDYAIWTRYQPTARSAFTDLYFNVRLGWGDQPVQEDDAKLRDAWYDLNAKRADVVATTTNGPWIIELRHMANANAIGRLLQYRQLWMRDPPLPGAVVLVLVTDRHDPDLIDLGRSMAIQVITA